MPDFLIRKATGNDLSAIETIYNKIHDAEAAGLQTTGWIRGVYPVRQTTEAALQRDDLYVLEENGQVLGAAIINLNKLEEKLPTVLEEIAAEKANVLSNITVAQ